MKARVEGGLGLGASGSRSYSGFVPHGDRAGLNRRPDQKDFIVASNALDRIYS